MAGARFVAQRGLLKPLVWSLVRVKVVGAEPIERFDGPFIAVANHSSHLDAPLIIGALPRKRTRYLAAGAAADYFFEVWWRKWLTTLFFNAFAIERNAEGKRAGASRALLERGVPLLIFPEGGRTREGALTRFKPGAAALSIATAAPCLPIALVGAAAGPVGLHNVAGGSIAAGSTDAVNGGQVYALALTAVNAVSYNTDANGARTNTVTLAGGNAAAPVTIANVAAGTVAAGSAEAVNGGQLFTTNQAVATAQGTANSALALGSNSVQYGPSRTNVTFNAGGQATVLSNVAAGVSTTDAVNVGQLNSGINSAVTQANAYTDGRIAALNFDLRSVRRDSYAGTSSALAAAGLPQAYEAGKGMVAIGGGTYAGQSAVAVGMSKAFNDGHTVVKLSGTYDSQGKAGASGGVGYQF